MSSRPCSVVRFGQRDDDGQAGRPVRPRHHVERDSRLLTGKPVQPLGMRFDRREVIEGLDTVFFRLRRADWQADFQAPRENRE